MTLLRIVWCLLLLSVVACDAVARSSPAVQDDIKAVARELMRTARRCPEACGEGETEESLLLRAIELDPSLVEAYEYLAIFYLNYGYPERPWLHKAVETCRRMQDALPDEARTYVCLYRTRKQAVGLSYPEQVQLARKAVELDPYSEMAWLWLSAVVESKEEQQTCLQNVLVVNPENERARQGLESLGVDPDSVSGEAAADSPAADDKVKGKVE